jgi:hypothetical protein
MPVQFFEIVPIHLCLRQPLAPIRDGESEAA